MQRRIYHGNFTPDLGIKILNSQRGIQSEARIASLQPFFSARINFSTFGCHVVSTWLKKNRGQSPEV